MKKVAVQAIELYQAHLSPWKGFTCAHLVLHGGVSCSEAVKRIVETEGLFKGASSIRSRFVACAAAYGALSEWKKPDDVSDERWEELMKRRGCLGDIFDCDPGPSRRCEYGICVGLPDGGDDDEI